MTNSSQFRTVLFTALIVSIAAWMGALIMLFMAVTALFKMFNHTTAGVAAAKIFWQFEWAQLVPALVASLAGLLWINGRGSRLRKPAFALVLFASLAAVVSLMFISPHIEHLRIEQLTNTPEFAKWHGISMSVYLAQTVALFIAAMIVPAANLGTSRAI